MEDYIVKINDMTVSYHKKTCIMGCGFENSLGGEINSHSRAQWCGGEIHIIKGYSRFN